MNIISKDIEEYLSGLREEREDFFLEMEREAAESDFPIIGPDVGNLLYVIALFSGAKKILELGSGFGYSASFFAKAVRDDGKIVCTDTSEENHKRALYYFSRSGYNSSIDYFIGDSIKTAENLEGDFDIIFNDIDKEQYPLTIDLAFEKLRQGGIFITDNILWDGKVSGESGLDDEPTAAVRRFNKMLLEDSRFTSSFIPLRDGLAMAVKN